MKFTRIIPFIILSALMASCAPAQEPEASDTPLPTISVISPQPSQSAPTASAPPAVDTSQYDAYSSARRQITRNYSEYVGNYERTFGDGDTVELPESEADPFINISVPMLIDADRGVLEEILSKPLEFPEGDALNIAYRRLYASLEPFEAAYKAAQHYFLDGDAAEDSFARAQELHTAMIATSREYSAALSAFTAEIRVLDKLRREERLNALLSDGHKVRYQVEGMLAYGGDVEDFLSAYGDDAPYHEGDAEAFRALYIAFARYADAVAAFTDEELIADGFNEDFAHMFPNFFAATIKTRVIAGNVLAIMEAGDMDAQLDPLPPEIDSFGMDPTQAVPSFEENLSTVSKLYNAFTA